MSPVQSEQKKMKVKYSYLDSQFKNAEPIVEDVKKLLGRGDFTLGAAVNEFETSFAKLCGVKHAIGVNSGTDAITLILKAMDIGPGDEVITASNSFIASAGAIAMAGAAPALAEVKEDYNIDPASVANLITKKTKAILPVHLTGNPADMDEILALGRKHNIAVIEDAAQAIEAQYKGKRVGSMGIAAEFSLHPLKNLNVWGDGGVVTTNSDAIAQKVKLLRNHGLINRDEAAIFGGNSRLDTLQAIVGNHMLREVHLINETRIRHAAYYDKALAGLGDNVVIPKRDPNKRQVYHTYVIQVKKREELIAYLAEQGIETKIHYPIPIHRQQCSKYLGYKKGDFPIAEAQAEKILTLPVHQALTQEQMDYVAEHIRRFYKG